VFTEVGLSFTKILASIDRPATEYSTETAIFVQGEKGGSAMEVKHLATELMGLGVYEGQLVGEVLGEDGLDDGHADVANPDDSDLGMVPGG